MLRGNLTIDFLANMLTGNVLNGNMLNGNRLGRRLDNGLDNRERVTGLATLLVRAVLTTNLATGLVIESKKSSPLY
jgi:hypothetical protein